MDLTRRRLLLAGAVAPLAACTSRTSHKRQPAPSADDPVTLARKAAAAAELDLAGRHEAAIAAHPALETRLGPMLEHHRKHVGALIPTATSTTPSSTPVSSASATPTPAPAAVALRELAAAERVLATSHLAALEQLPGDLAMLFASLSAAAASHAAELSRR